MKDRDEDARLGPPPFNATETRLMRALDAETNRYRRLQGITIFLAVLVIVLSVALGVQA